MKQLISHQLVKYLEDRGVEYLFGLCGHTNIAVLAAMKDSKIKFVNTRHEQIAAHIADGYARAKRTTAVVLSHLGPGLTNASTGVANAALDSIPMVVIAGDIPSHYYGKHPHQEVNLHADASQSEIYRPFVKRVWRVERPDLFPEIIEKAFQLAESGRPGPVLVSVPMDIFSMEIDTSLFKRLSGHTRALHKPSMDEPTGEKIVRALLEAKSPLIYAGGGVILAGAADELREFATHLAIPVAHTLMGKGVLPDDHPLTLGMTGFWGTKFVNDKCLSADWIIGLGTRFAEADCSSWDTEFTFSMPPSKLIHIDIDSNEIGRNFPVEIGVVTDLKEALVVLNRVARRLLPKGRTNDKLTKEIAELPHRLRRRRTASTSRAASSRCGPSASSPPCARCCRATRIITTDVGWNKNGVGQQFPIYTPGSILTPGGYATMGFGAPAALGAKLACPDKVVVALVGDGGFGQNPSVLATAVEMGIPVIWVIMNNFAYGTIAGLQMAHYGTTIGCVFRKDGEPYSPDFAAVARAYGAEGVQIKSADEFKTVLARAVASGKPFVIDVAMLNEPVPTAGHWNINDIYSPGRAVSHVAMP